MKKERGQRPHIGRSHAPRYHLNFPGRGRLRPCNGGRPSRPNGGGAPPFSRAAHRGRSSAPLTKARTSRLLSGLARGDYSPDRRIVLYIAHIIMLSAPFVNVKWAHFRKFPPSDKVEPVSGRFFGEIPRSGKGVCPSPIPPAHDGCALLFIGSRSWCRGRPG